MLHLCIRCNILSDTHAANVPSSIVQQVSENCANLIWASKQLFAVACPRVSCAVTPSRLYGFLMAQSWVEGDLTTSPFQCLPRFLDNHVSAQAIGDATTLALAI